MKYRKKPVEVEAFKWTGCPEQTEDPLWVIEAIKSGNAWFCADPFSVIMPPRVTHMAIKTLEGIMEAQFGDYIIRGVKGEIYPCRADIFEATYEAVK